jgi:hypothetical protein
MISKLTKTQENQIPKYIEKYVSLASKPTDRVKATKAIGNLYKSIGEKKPIVIYAQSPFAAAVMVAMTRLLSKDKNLAKEGSQLRSQLRSQLYSQLDSQLDSQLRSQLRSQLDSQLYSQLDSQLYSQLYSQLRSQLDSINSDWWLIVWWLVWAGWYAFGEYIGVKFNLKKYRLFMDFVTSVSFLIPYKGICFVSENPRIKWSEGRLHNETGKSIEYADGYGLYNWKGVKVPEKLIMGKITKKDILSETNAEVRRCMYEKLGAEKYAKLLGIKQINKGQRGILYKSKDKDSLKEDYLYFVKVICPTTQRVYFLGTEETEDADEAVARSFGMSKDEYQPIVET